MSDYYRKKPVVIEARQFGPVPEWVVSGGNYDLIQWIIDGAGQAKLHIDAAGSVDAILIWTLEGEMVASPGDWIIKGVQGEFYPCKPDIFAATHESVDDVPTPA